MAEVKIVFIGAYSVEQQIGGPDEMLAAEAAFKATFPDGKTFKGTTRIKQTVGSSYKDKMIEVGQPVGLPPDRIVPWDEFSEAARNYFTERIVKPGS